MTRIVFFVILAVLFSVEGSALYGQRQEMHQISFPTDDFNAGNGIVQHRGHLSGVDFSQATLNNVGNRVNQQNHISHPSDDVTAQDGLSQNHRLSTGVDFSQETLKTEGNKKDKQQHQNIDDVSPTHDVSITQHGMTVAWPTTGDVQPRNPVLDNHFKLSQPGQSLMQLKNTPNYVLVPRDYVLNAGADLNPNFDFKVRSLVDPAQHSSTKKYVVSAVKDSSTQQKDISSSNFQDRVMDQQHRLSLSPFLNQHASTKQKVVHAVQDSSTQQKDISSSNFQDQVMGQQHRLSLSPFLNQHSSTKQNVVHAGQDSPGQHKDILSSKFQDDVTGQQHRLSLSPFLNQHSSTKHNVVHAVQNSPIKQKDISSSNFQNNVMNQQHRLTLSPYLNQQNLKLEAPLPVNNFKSSKSDSNFQQTNPEPLMVQESNPEFLPMGNQHSFQLNAPVELHNLKDILPSQDARMHMVVDDTWSNHIGKPTATSFKENNVFNDKMSRFNGLRVLIAEQNKGSKFHPRQQSRGRKTVHKKRQAVRKVQLASHRETINFAKLAPTLSSGRAFQSRSGNALHEKGFSPTTNTRIALASNRHVEGSQFAKNRVPSVTGKTFGGEPIPAMQNRGFFPQQTLAATTDTREISRKRLPPMTEIFGGASLFKPRPHVIKFFHMNPKTQDLLSFRG
ncbi:uncharacterized protein LOC127734382 [Mytilus californianus]|uniref:uncharacterized protein LOC127734382 n=1 Tax=Mytilus californianus TaxID=6549 RepID=UPI002245DFEC|nr:uncharacterized protein LOC127734382 [Mytilus californianus]XP_052100179.1 uncharacterized protein LOC127734382 [Mytilus californianus]